MPIAGMSPKNSVPNKLYGRTFVCDGLLHSQDENEWLCLIPLSLYVCNGIFNHYVCCPPADCWMRPSHTILSFEWHIYIHKSNANSRFPSLVTFIALAPLHAWWCCQWWWLCHRWDFYRTWETSILSNCCRFIPMQCKQTNKQTNNIAFYFIYI